MNMPALYSESAECWLSSELDQIAPAIARLGAFLKLRGIAENVWKSIELAVTEAVNNAVMHGCKGREAEGVWLRWNWSEDLLTVVVQDPSEFMPDAPTADLPDDPLSESGRGHFLMATLMDGVAHILIDGRHAMELTKQVGPMSMSPEILVNNEVTLNELSSELGNCYENLSAVFRFSEILATARDFDEFSETVLLQLNMLVRAQQSYIRLESEDHSALLRTVSVGTGLESLPMEIRKEQECLETEVFKTRAGQGMENSSTLIDDDPLKEVQGAITVCPIFFRSDVLGCLTVVRPTRGEIFLASESALIRVVADFLGIAYVAGRLHEQHKVEDMIRRELEIASSIQQSLLPRTFPDRAPYRTFGLCRSAREVGGDYFDLIPIEDRGLLLVIADVMGKGIPAALLATIFRTAVQSRPDMAMTPGKLLTEINRQLASDLDNLDMFITAKLAFLSYDENLLYYADAGHCPILIRRIGDPALIQVQADGYPLGVSNRFEYPADVFRIEPGDTLIFITDGIYENLDEHGMASSFDYLMNRILALKHRDLSDFCNQVIALSEGTAATKPLLDDRTILVLERDK